METARDNWRKEDEFASAFGSRKFTLHAAVWVRIEHQNGDEYATDEDDTSALAAEQSLEEVLAKLKELSRRFGADEDGFISIDDHDRLKQVFPEFHRDTGEDILRLIQNGGVLSGSLQNDLDFSGDSLYCEWGYVVDFDERTFEVYKGFNKEPLDATERFVYMKHNGKYHPVKLAASFWLDGLPSDEAFLEALKDGEEDE